jgi:hypothetical protein
MRAPNRTGSVLVDLRGFYLRVGPGVDEGNASSNHAPAEKPHHVDDLTRLGEVLAAVFVEDVDRVGRVL